MLQSSLSELLFAWLTGAFTAILGVGVAYILSFSRDIRIRKKEIQDSLSIIQLELKNVHHNMKSKEGMRQFSVSGYELMKQKGICSELPFEPIADIMKIYGKIEELNDIVKFMRNTMQAFITTRDMKDFHFSDFREDFEAIKIDCQKRISSFLPNLDHFLKTKKWE